MGGQLSSEELLDLQRQTDFSEEDVKQIHKKFKSLDTNKSDGLSIDEFMAVPELVHNPLVRRVVSTFDADSDGEVDFKEFITAISVFSKISNYEEKLQFTFKIYDVDGDGFISNGDLFQVLKAMVGNNLNDIQLQQLVDRTILQGDTDKDGRLNFEEFCEMVKDSDLNQQLSIRLSFQDKTPRPSASGPASS
jgi:serine/threonine-protein phosphatase 2B regulatory subunit